MKEGKLNTDLIGGNCVPRLAILSNFSLNNLCSSSFFTQLFCCIGCICRFKVAGCKCGDWLGVCEGVCEGVCKGVSLGDNKNTFDFDEAEEVVDVRCKGIADCAGKDGEFGLDFFVIWWSWWAS